MAVERGVKLKKRQEQPGVAKEAERPVSAASRAGSFSFPRAAAWREANWRAEGPGVLAAREVLKFSSLREA